MLLLMFLCGYARLDTCYYAFLPILFLEECISTVRFFNIHRANFIAQLSCLTKIASCTLVGRGPTLALLVGLGITSTPGFVPLVVLQDNCEFH